MQDFINAVAVFFCRINSCKIPEQENVSIMFERLGNIRTIGDFSAYHGKKLRFV